MLIDPLTLTRAIFLTLSIVSSRNVGLDQLNLSWFGGFTQLLLMTEPLKEMMLTSKVVRSDLKIINLLLLPSLSRRIP